MAAPSQEYAYSNPYYEESWAPAVAALDYSQPISVPTVTTAPVEVSQVTEVTSTEPSQVTSTEVTSPAPSPGQSEEPEVPNEALERFDSARAAFKGGDYAKAQQLVEQAIELLPQDATLHEFRALTLFAQKDYQKAAAAIYAVLSAGPGWNWDTMATMYADKDKYVQQLRALEAYARDNPKSTGAHFLLAYHYLVLDHAPEAVKQLQEVVKLSPNDQLAKQLVQAFTKPESSTPSPSQ
jgi:tetratricopeptide (TPR) repeat protein